MASQKRQQGFTWIKQPVSITYLVIEALSRYHKKEIVALLGTFRTGLLAAPFGPDFNINLHD
jgi:hypothetical protein